MTSSWSQTLWEGFKCSRGYDSQPQRRHMRASFEASFSPFAFLSWRWGTCHIRVVLNAAAEGILPTPPTHTHTNTHTHTQTHTHKPELALTSLNVNIYYLCTDHDTSDAPCWLHVCLMNVCARVRESKKASASVVYVRLCSLVLNVHFLSGDVVGWNFRKSRKKVGREPMALRLRSNWGRREKSKNLWKKKWEQKKKAREFKNNINTAEW